MRLIDVNKSNKVKEDYMGFITLTLTLIPKSQDEKDQVS